MAAKRSTRSSGDQIACYLLKKSTPGVKDVTSAVGNDGGFNQVLRLMGIERTSVTASEGEFLLPLSTSQTSPGNSPQRYYLRRDATITLSCPPGDVAGLTEEEVRYLERAEPTPERRYTLYSYPGFKTFLPSYSEPTHTRGSSSNSQGKANEATYKPSSQPSRELESHRENPSSSRSSSSKSASVPSHPFETGSTVIVPSVGPHGSSYYGVIKWLGLLPNVQDLMAGIELEENVQGCTDGTYIQKNLKFFHCPPQRGLYYLFRDLKPDDRLRTDPEYSHTQTRDGSSDTLRTQDLSQEKEKSLHKHLTEKEKEKHFEQLEREREKPAKQVDFEEKDKLAKKLPLDDSSLDERTPQVHEQVRQITLQLETEKRRRQQLEIELAFEKRKVEDLSRDLKKEREKNSNLKIVDGETFRGDQPPRLATLQRGSDLKLSWKIARRDVLKIRTIGGGAWGLVYEGNCNRQSVAIKEPHMAIMSEDTNRRMEREINIMALVQHPNLVRFVGAVMDEDAIALKQPPLLITELLDTDLRSAYKRYNLEPSWVLIFRDVAYALHYLHEHQDPIIHRDVSAPNVLLEALPNNMWRAKLSDFGSANLAKFSQTAGEGALVYSAPETFPSPDPRKPLAKQTTKIDTFSFGILICEVITCKQPNPEKRVEIFREVQMKWRLMYNLVIECTRQKPEERLTMASILKVLNEIPRRMVNRYDE